jgi:flagellar motor switch/type III secretory pathway protein FliN
MEPLLSKEELSELLAPLKPESDPGSGAHSLESTSAHPARIRVEFKCSQALQRELLLIKRGSILVLDEPSEIVELFVENQLVARGELIRTDGRTAVKITQVYNLPK